MITPIPRRQFMRHLALTGAAAWVAGPPNLRAADEFTVMEFEKIHKALQPPADELWSTIPWKMEIVDACNLPAKEKKPILMRVRSGHPLGCV